MPKNVILLSSKILGTCLKSLKNAIFFEIRMPQIGGFLKLRHFFKIFVNAIGKASIADVAQLVEQLICNQLVGGSSPLIGSNANNI